MADAAQVQRSFPSYTCPALEPIFTTFYFFTSSATSPLSEGNRQVQMSGKEEYVPAISCTPQPCPGSHRSHFPIMSGTSIATRLLSYGGLYDTVIARLADLR